MSQIQVKLDKAKGTLTIVLPLQTPTVSKKTGKTKLIATTHGNFKSDQVFDGQPVTVGVNAYIPNLER